MAKMKFPNPKFFRAKDNVDWKAQGRNLQEVGGIIWDMLKETDWKAFAAKQKANVQDNVRRVVREAKTIAAMTPAERLDLLKTGEKHLGTLYRKGDMVTVRREWRGVADTAYDFKEWLRMWGMLLGTFSKDLVPALNMTFYYRWMISYMCCVSFMDKNTMGQRSNALKMSHLLIYDIFRYVAENLVFLAKCDKKNGNSAELNKKVVLFDEMTMGQIMAGFPDLLGIPYQLMPVFLVSEIDQLTCVPYIDAVESFGLPADTCPVPSSVPAAMCLWPVVVAPHDATDAAAIPTAAQMKRFEAASSQKKQKRSPATNSASGSNPLCNARAISMTRNASIPSNAGTPKKEAVLRYSLCGSMKLQKLSSSSWNPYGSRMA